MTCVWLVFHSNLSQISPFLNFFSSFTTIRSGGFKGQGDAWVAQWLSVCLQLRSWSWGSRIKSHIGPPAGILLLPLLLSVCLSWINKVFKKKKGVGFGGGAVSHVYTYIEDFTSMMENRIQMLETISKRLLPHPRCALWTHQMCISANTKFLHIREHASFRCTYCVPDHFHTPSLEQIGLYATVVDLEWTPA